MSLKTILRNAVVTGAVTAVKNRLSSRKSRSKKQTSMLSPGRLTSAAVVSLISCFGIGHWLNSGSTEIEKDLEAIVADIGSGQSTEKKINTSGTTAPVSNGSSFTRTENLTSPSSGPQLLVGSFNIEVFGRSKMGNSSVSKILVDIARKFDLLAIQELRSMEQGIMDEFLKLVNADGSQFRYIVGPRQGYTTSKEQYVFLYDSLKLEVLSMPFLIPDDTNKFHRPPLVAYFRSRELPPEQAFSFVALNVHTDPDEIKYELPRLQDMIQLVRSQFPREDDIILMGDLNAGPNYFMDYRWFPQQFAAIKDEWTTNTREKMNYDNIVFDANSTLEFSGRSGVLNFRRAYAIESLEDAISVSDHFPVWAQFSCQERSTTGLASGENGASTR